MSETHFLLEMDECQEAAHHVVDAASGQRVGTLLRHSDGSIGYWPKPGNKELHDVWWSLPEAKRALERAPELIR